MFYIYANDTMIYHLANPELYLVKPKLKLEMGKAGSLEFGILSDHPYFDRLIQLSTIVTVQFDETEIFRGRVLSNKRDFNNIRTIYCEGDLSYLVDSVQKFTKYNGKVHALFKKFISNHNTRVKDAAKQFTVGNITVENRDIKLVGQDEEVNTGNIDYKQIAINATVGEWNTTYDMIQTCIIDYTGGYLNTRRVDGVTYIDLLAYPDDTITPATQAIELGVNMLDLEEEVTAEDLFTVLIPLGDDNLTIKSVNKGSDELVDETAVAQYGRIVKTHVFSNVNEASTLLTNGKRYLASQVNIPTTITVSALDLHIINPDYEMIRLCDRVHIKSTPHNLVEYLACTEIEYDLENPGNNKYTFGNPIQTLTERYKEDKRKQADTYSNGSGYGGSTEAAIEEAVEEAVDEAGTNADTKLHELYDTYIDLDGTDGTITLRELWYFSQTSEKVLGWAGIDLTATEESQVVSITSVRDDVAKTANELSKYKAEVKTITDDQQSAIEMRATYDDVSASITTVANNLKSMINLKADQVTIDAELIELNGRIATLEADDIFANRLKTSIATISGLTVASGSVQGTWSVNGEMRATSITTGDGEPVYSYMHSHVITANDDGTVSFGVATKKIPQSFNIADTNFYKDGVSAAATTAAQSISMKSLGVGSAGSPYTYNDTTYSDVAISYTMQATQGDGSLYSKPGSLTKAVDVSKVYKAVTISSIEATSIGSSKATVKATASNGNTGTGDIDVSSVYKAGIAVGEAKFKEVSVTPIKTPGKTRYKSGSTKSGVNQGSYCNRALYWGSNGTYYPYNDVAGGSAGALYFEGSNYSYTLRGDSETVYDKGTTTTYYEKTG